MKFRYIKKAYPVILLALVIVIAVSLLVASEGVSRAIMESRQDPETLELLQGIFPEANFYTFDMDTEIYTLYDSGRSKAGYAFYGEGAAFSPGMVILIGLEDEETIKDIIVISQRETKLYWDMINRSDFFYQFQGLKIEDCVLKEYKKYGEVDGVTGATYSCRGIANIVRKTSLEKIEFLN